MFIQEEYISKGLHFTSGKIIQIKRVVNTYLCMHGFCRICTTLMEQLNNSRTNSMALMIISTCFYFLCGIVYRCILLVASSLQKNHGSGKGE